MKRIRSFVACELPLATIEGLGAYQRSLKESLDAEGLSLRWASPTALHLTLRFLGEIEEALVSALGDALAHEVRRVAPFAMRIEGVGCFPRPRKARVLWAGVVGRRLPELYEAVQAGLERVGLQRETRPFHPHVTLARLKVPADLSGVEASPPRLRRAEVEVPEVVLFSSTLTSSGPVYRALRRAALRGA